MPRYAFLFLASALFAQTQPAASPAVRPEIRGTVHEPGTNAPVVDAEVTVDYHGATQPAFMPSPPKSSTVLKTDDSGRFSYTPPDLGFFNVKVKKDGYTPGGQTAGITPTNEAFTLTADAPLHEIQFFLARPATITGHVVDEETDKPIAGFSLVAARANNFAGRRMFMGSGSGITDAQGRFQTTGQPGDYVAVIRPKTAPADRVRTTFTAADLEAVDKDYAETYWPGGHDQQAALPMTVTSGGTVDLGVIAVRKVPYYRVHVKVSPAGCVAGDTLSVNEYKLGYQGEQNTNTLSSKVPCGVDLLVTGFAPGAYRLVLVTGKGPDGRRMASAPFVINNQNVEVTAALEAGIALEGKYVLADGAKTPDFTTFHVPMLNPMGALPFGDVLTQNAVNADGTFRVVGIPTVDHRIQATGLPAGFYVKEVRYNGAAVTTSIVPLERPAMVHALTLVVDDKPATVAGAVMDGDKPVGKAYVIATRWPLPPNLIFIATASTTADDQGHFQIGGLAPGEYRFVAVRGRNDDRDRAPGKLEKALELAGKVDVSAGTVQNINLAPVDVR